MSTAPTITRTWPTWRVTYGAHAATVYRRRTAEAIAATHEKEATMQSRVTLHWTEARTLHVGDVVQLGGQPIRVVAIARPASSPTIRIILRPVGLAEVVYRWALEPNEKLHIECHDPEHDHSIPLPAPLPAQRVNVTTWADKIVRI